MANVLINSMPLRLLADNYRILMFILTSWTVTTAPGPRVPILYTQLLIP